MCVFLNHCSLTMYCWICRGAWVKGTVALWRLISFMDAVLVSCFFQIFSRYEKHRDLILEDIFASLRRLPTTKRNLRSFKLVDSILRTILCFVNWFNDCRACRLSSGQHIQMMAALILQLVQCIVVSPKSCSHEASPQEQEGQQKEIKVRKAYCIGLNIVCSWYIVTSVSNSYHTLFCCIPWCNLHLSFPVNTDIIFCPKSHTAASSVGQVNLCCTTAKP